MFILQSLPEGVPKPEPFVQGSRALLEEVTRKIEETYHSDESGAVTAEWVQFRDDIAPQSDDVAEHIKMHPEHWHVPFREKLFGGAQCVHGESIPGRERKSRTAGPTKRDRESKQLDYVQWSRRGKPLPKDDPARSLPNLVVRGPADVEFSVPVACRSKKAKTKVGKSKKRTAKDVDDDQQKEELPLLFTSML